MVDILTGVMSGAHFATQVRKWTLTGSQDGAPNLGQVFIAVDPNCFAPDFEDRMTEMNGILRNLPPVRTVSLLFIVHFQRKSCKKAAPTHWTQLAIKSWTVIWVETLRYSFIDRHITEYYRPFLKVYEKTIKNIFCQYKLTAMFFVYFFCVGRRKKNSFSSRRYGKCSYGKSR